MANLGWLSLSEAIDMLAPDRGDQPSRRDAAQRILAALTSGSIVATALDARGERLEIAADDWTRGKPNWRESMLVINPRVGPPFGFAWPLAVAHDGVMNRPNLNPRAINFDADGRPKTVDLRSAPPERRYFSIRLPQTGVHQLTPAPAIPKGKRGRGKEFDWAELEAIAKAEMQARGYPSKRCPNQTQLIEHIQTEYAKKHGQEPARSSLWEPTGNWIKDFLASQLNS